MKRLVNVKTVVGAVMAILAGLIFLTNKLDVWGFPLPASKSSVTSLTIVVSETRQVVWTRAKRSDQRDLWELDERCRANGGCTVDQADQRRRLLEDIQEAKDELEQIKKSRQ